MNKGKHSNGWSKSSLIKALAYPVLFYSPYTFALSDTLNKLFSGGALPTALALLTVGIIAHVFTPIVAYYLKRRNAINSFYIFTATSVRQAKDLYGDTKKYSKIFRQPPLQTNPVDANTSASSDNLYQGEVYGWQKILMDAGFTDEAPEVFEQVHSYLQDFIDEDNLKAGEDRYIPHFAYSAMPAPTLDHDHPIWSFRPGDSRIFSRYLLSQLQLQNTIQNAYSETMLVAAKSCMPSRVTQWYDWGHYIMEDLANQYLSTIETEKHLRSKTRWWTYLWGWHNLRCKNTLRNILNN